MPLEKVFLETDDSPIEIADVYKAAALIRNTPEDDIILQVKRNFNKVFGI